MKKIILLILVMCLSCVSSGAEIGRMLDGTVYLVRLDSGKWYPKCSGVWVGWDKVLTAAHCIEGDIEYIYGHDKRMVMPVMGKVIKIDHEMDLALVEMIGIVPHHGIVSIYDGELYIGTDFHIVGHPMGLGWTYIRGMLSALRVNRYGDMILQVNSSAYFGNSGGGLFNDRGELVGICSSIHDLVPMATFFVSPSSIKLFLGDEL